MRTRKDRTEGGRQKRGSSCAKGTARLEAPDAGSRPAAVTDLPGRQPDYCAEPPWAVPRDGLCCLSILKERPRLFFTDELTSNPRFASSIQRGGISSRLLPRSIVSKIHRHTEERGDSELELRRERERESTEQAAIPNTLPDRKLARRPLAESRGSLGEMSVGEINVSRTVNKLSRIHR